METNVYETNRKELMGLANTAIEEGNVEEANAKMKEVKELDANFEKMQDVQKDMAVLNANANALNNTSKVNSLDDSVVGVLGGTNMTGKVVEEVTNYTDVFAKVLMGKDLNEAEATEFSKVNNAAYTHQAKDQPLLIPETVVGGIMGMIAKQYPFFGEVRKYNVKGNITFKKHSAITAGDASFVDEGTPAVDEKNTFVEVTLKGFELAKLVRVSFKLEAMSIPEFISFIQAEIAERIGYVLGEKIFTGTGTGEPKGLLPELAATGTAQVIETKEVDKVGYADLTAMRALIASPFASGIKFYAKSETIWGHLANILDTNGKPVFITNPVDGGIGTIFGVPVVEDDGVPKDELVLGNASVGMVANTNEPLTVQSEKNLTARETVFLGYTIIDWTVTQVKAFAHLKLKVA